MASKRQFGVNHAPEPKPSGQCEECKHFLRSATAKKDDYCMYRAWVVGSQWWSSNNCGVKNENRVR